MKTAQLSTFILIALITLGVSACTLQFNTRIEADGSGELGVEFGLRPDELGEVAAVAPDLDSLCGAAAAFVRLPAGAQTYLEQRGEERWCGVAASFADLPGLTALLADQPGVQVNQIAFLEDRLIFDVTIDLTRRLTIQDQKYPAPDVAWQLTVPGTLVGHNADASDGNTLTWVIRRNELRNLRAESVLELPGNLFGTGLPLSVLALVGLPCLCLLALSGGGLAWWRVRQRKAG